jgi:hypothetical protein
LFVCLSLMVFFFPRFFLVFLSWCCCLQDLLFFVSFDKFSYFQCVLFYVSIFIFISCLFESCTR